MKCLSFQLHVREPMTEFLDPLCRALRTNRGLVDLVFEGTGIGHFSLFLILQAIQYHPSLLKMKVTMTEDRRQGFDRAHNTHVSHHVREFLAINHHIEQVELPQELIDQEVWDAIVTPCLECNIFRKRLSAVFPPNGSRRRRAALLEAVLQRLRDNHPSAMWLFLQSNQDIVAERLTLLREF